eukprot:Plantae.Rhodophyta-Rhodochaete_pulchella.ctg662.p1 GENE.Plantae.Rhodophyta-Rhodochaete_pulchella.ctg662~~Plantae.Rhodophyta-Rhodochaete_pulchella.ctg662.p1  ORF type:complete len:339 (-),score=39.06 Plantae.Rhodophyta-Rhodochaete_pulchella.ctg662:1249-2265(-)
MSTQPDNDGERGQWIQVTHRKLKSSEKRSTFHLTEPTSWSDFVFAKPESPIPELFAHVKSVLVGVNDFHLRIVRVSETQPVFEVNVTYGRNPSELVGPVSASRCMSCDDDCPLTVGLEGDDRKEGCSSEEKAGGLTSRDTALQEVSPLTRCWLDAKARNMIIVTPKRHVESIYDLTDEEHIALWQSTVLVLRQNGLRDDDFQAMILNGGLKRNHAHVHVKIRVPYVKFERVAQDLGAKWTRLREFAAENARPEFFNVLRKSDSSNKTVFVGDLGRGVSENVLKNALATENITPRRVTFKRSTAFLQFESHEEAARCICAMYNKSIGEGGSPYFWWSRA